MRARDCVIVFVLGSVGCHDCGHDEPREESDTDPFAGSEGCGFICTSDGSSGSAFTNAALDETSADASSGTTGAIGPQDECTMTSECGAGSFCVAPFDQTLGPEGKGPYACVLECVPLGDEDLWCADAAACCDPEAECTDRGYCERRDATGTEGSDSGGTDDAGTDDTAGDSGSDAGSGSTGG